MSSSARRRKTIRAISVSKKRACYETSKWRASAPSAPKIWDTTARVPPSMSTTKVHPSAIVDPGVQIGRGVEIAPFCVIGPDAVIGDGTILQSHIVIEGRVTIGARNFIGHGAIIGAAPQDLSFSR